jgi:ABC-type polysaccharide/polyol phosphate export permease
MIFPASSRRHRRPTPGLVWTLIRTDFKSRYHGTLGGFAWALLKPLTMFIVLMGVFSFLFRSDPDYKTNLIIGLFIWDFFADSTKTGLLSLAARGYLLTKADVAPWVLVVTSISNSVITLGVFSLVMVGFSAFSGHLVTPLGASLFASYLFQLLIMAIGISLATSVLFLKFRDLNQVWEVATQAGFFLAPVIYPLSIIPERLHLWLYLWPPTAVIQFSRQVLVQGNVPTLRAHFALGLMTAGILLLGSFIFNRYATRAVEQL